MRIFQTKMKLFNHKNNNNDNKNFNIFKYITKNERKISFFNNNNNKKNLKCRHKLNRCWWWWWSSSSLSHMAILFYKRFAWFSISTKKKVFLLTLFLAFTIIIIIKCSSTELPFWFCIFCFGSVLVLVWWSSL